MQTSATASLQVSMNTELNRTNIQRHNQDVLTCTNLNLQTLILIDKNKKILKNINKSNMQIASAEM